MGIFIGGVKHAGSYNLSLHRVQAAQLYIHKKQKEQSRSYGTEEILQVLQVPYRP